MVSIIMAAFNAENTISLAIDSVLSQTYKDFELLVIDDCSTDRTINIIGEYCLADCRIRLFRNNRNHGVSFTRRYGLEKAKGEWIAILDSDDIWERDKLEKQLQYQGETGADLVFTGSAFVDLHGSYKKWILHVPLSIDFRKLLKQNLISNSSVVVKKEIFIKHYVSEDNLHEDYATWLSILRDGYSAKAIDEPLLIYRVSPLSKTGNKLKSAQMNWNTYKYIGLCWIERLYYMGWYMVNGLLKYRHLK